MIFSATPLWKAFHVTKASLFTQFSLVCSRFQVQSWFTKHRKHIQAKLKVINRMRKILSNFHTAINYPKNNIRIRLNDKSLFGSFKSLSCFHSLAKTINLWDLWEFRLSWMLYIRPCSASLSQQICDGSSLLINVCHGAETFGMIHREWLSAIKRYRLFMHGGI